MKKVAQPTWLLVWALANASPRVNLAWNSYASTSLEYKTLQSRPSLREEHEGDEGDEGNWDGKGDEWDSQDLFMAERPSSPLPAPPSKLETID